MENYVKFYLTTSEAAKFLGVHRSTLQKWIEFDQEIKKNNILAPDHFKCPPYGRIGRRYRFRREDLEKFLKDSNC